MEVDLLFIENRELVDLDSLSVSISSAKSPDGVAASLKM